MNGFSFAYPWVLWLLALLPPLALLRSRRGPAAAVVYSSLAPFQGLGHPRRARLGGFCFWLLLAVLASGIIALARPRTSQVSERVEASGVDIMLALDVSLSMMAEDITIGQERANRLEAVKKVTEEFIAERKNDRIGITAFSGKPYLVSPMTLDHDWLLKNLERVRVGLVEDGTAIGSAIASSANRLKDQKNSKSRVLVLLTDGDNNAGRISPVTAAQAAEAVGIKIYAISVGSGEAARIPQRDQFGRVFYLSVPALVDEKTLREVARIGGGEFYRATDAKSLERIFSQIDSLEKSTVETTETRRYDDLFPWCLGAAVLLLGMYLSGEYVLAQRLP